MKSETRAKREVEALAKKYENSDEEVDLMVAMLEEVNEILQDLKAPRELSEDLIDLTKVIANHQY